MSQSPRAASSPDGFASYREGWRSTMQMLRDGRSFSGHERNCAFLNCEGEPFADFSFASGLDFDDDGRAVCATDWDHDGDIDLWFHNRTGPRLRFMRNEIRTEGQAANANYLSLQLQGTISNRDAIGARVTVWLESDERPIVKTLTAGDGFLSQSSKTLHFGLGSRDIRLVEVQWPNGNTASYVGIECNSRYKIVEGTELAQQIDMPRPGLAIHDAEQETVVASGETRTILSNRLPLPMLSYATLDGSQQQIEPSGRPQLIVFWASWCPSCKGLLREIKQNVAAIEQQGVDVILVSLDEYDIENANGAANAKQLAKELSLPFEIGIAKPPLVEKLRLAESVLFNRVPPLAVPYSFLLDEFGNIAAVYRGQFAVESFLSDASSLSKSAIERRDAAVPFAGIWNSPPKQMLLRAVAHVFQENGYSDDYARYLQMDTAMLERRLQFAKTPEEREQLNREYAAANYNLGVSLVAKNEHEQAFEYFDQAFKANPNHSDAIVNLAVIYARKRNIQKAIELLNLAIEIDPNSYQARMNLANALSAGGRFSIAIPHYQHLVDVGNARTATHSRLGRALLEMKRTPDAVVQFEAAINKGARDGATIASLAWLLATSVDPEVRDGGRALELARQLESDNAIPAVLRFELLAVAHAELADFEAAKEACRQALDSLGNRQPELRRIIAGRLGTYEKLQPTRDDDGKYP
ncbi:MAG: ASPIC/UnbV domain-containing protein [Planctomycetales bacterium]|nr:ASPIC/UnbV domain-containing protein [Planctomycetales bacterium]